MRSTWRKAALGALAFLTLVPAVTATPASAEQTTQERQAVPADDPPVVAAAKRDELLGQGWQASGDRLWTTTGDAEGLHVLTAEAKTGYSWRTIADLTVTGVETDQWIGHGCVTGSGQRAVIVYAPRTFTNKEDLTSRGGLTAVVDLVTGAVTKLPIRTTLSYYNPGCGTGETAALTQEGGDRIPKTGVVTVDTTTGKLSARTELDGQTTSATPVDGGFVVADAVGLLKVGTDGTQQRLVAGTGGVPFNVRADAQGGVVFMDLAGNDSRVRRAPSSRQARQDAPTLASGPHGSVGVASGTGGKVFVTGAPAKLAALPGAVAKLDVPADAEVSSLGQAAITDVVLAPVKPGTKAASDPHRPRPVHIATRSLRTGKTFGFGVDPGETLKPRWNDTVDADRVCSVPRNDPGTQVYQPTPREVEWAADNAVTGARSQGDKVPAQILLGILGQESNLWQAARNIWAGEYGNPLVGNYYGLEIYDDNPSNDWDIRWDKADCGYGVTQTTDGMRLAGHPKPGEPDVTRLPSEQRQIGTQYLANVNSGLEILLDKWQQLQIRGMTLNNNDPMRIENWFYATWAYNSGLHDGTKPDDAGVVGLGWLNNPANPRYLADRANFGTKPSDFAHPERWPYPEKVLGFATSPPSGYEGPNQPEPFFRAATWNGATGPDTTPGTANYNRRTARPAPQTFCTADNNCSWGTAVQPDVPGEKPGPCLHRDSAGKLDLRCWVKTAATWKTDCSATCGFEFVRYDPGVGKPPDGASYPPRCDNNDSNPSHNGIVATAGVIDDVTTETKPFRPCRGIHANMAGSDFSFSYPSASSKIDLHQVGGGYGAHFWYGHTRSDTDEGRKTQLIGNWTFPSVDGLARLMVYIPSHLADADAVYVVDTANGPVNVPVRQRDHHDEWVPLGAFPFYGQPKVHLNTITAGANGLDALAFDAMAIDTVPDGPGYTPMIVNESSGPDGNYACLQLKGNVTKPGTTTEFRSCSKSWGYGYWNEVDAKVVINLPDSTQLRGFNLQDRLAGLCLQVADGRTDDGAPVVVAPCVAGDNNQIWTLPPQPTPATGTRRQFVVNLKTGKCLSLGNANPNGTSPVVQSTCDYGGNITTQYWKAYTQEVPLQ
ncbi:RICIN domain-containing protein [Amycolatopsis sp. NPDC049688]|uniref:RICIN domain-containing protein n=1 Tax=Amycolatopsis sp. NPDC049688 TaxID=3154733 RepID=UPI00343A6CD3